MTYVFIGLVATIVVALALTLFAVRRDRDAPSDERRE